MSVVEVARSIIQGQSAASGIDTSGARDWIEVASVAIEGVAVAIIVVAIAYSTLLYLRHFLPTTDPAGMSAYRLYKIHLGRALLLSLEILVAADIVRTVALEPTLDSVRVLGLLVVIRTFLSWSLVVELEQRWPWQRLPAREDTVHLDDA